MSEKPEVESAKDQLSREIGAKATRKLKRGGTPVRASGLAWA